MAQHELNQKINSIIQAALISFTHITPRIPRNQRGPSSVIKSTLPSSVSSEQLLSTIKAFKGEIQAWTLIDLL